MQSQTFRSLQRRRRGGRAEEDGKPYHFQRSWIRHKLRATPADLRIMHVEGDSMLPTLHHGDIVLVDLARRAPTPPGIFVLHDGMGLVAKRLDHIPNSEPPRVRIISDNPLYAPYEGTAEEVNIIGRIRWFAREI
jgi:phage repressor protein C with HTH and peptisase S24 domain